MKKNIYVLIGLVISGIFGRFLAPWPNFTPVLAAALFAGVHISDKKWAYLVPIVTMLISDLFFSFYPDMIFQYMAFVLVVFIGTLVKKVNFSILFTAIGCSVLFFLISNFGAWVANVTHMYPTSMYTADFAGLLLCYEMGLPFALNTFVGDVCFSALLFGGYELAIRFTPKLVLQPVKA